MSFEPKLPVMGGLESVEGWNYLKRDINGELVLEDEEKSTENVTSTQPAELLFTDIYGLGLDPDEVVEERGFSREQVDEVVEFTEESTGNLHELARRAYRKRKLVEEASGESVEKMMDRALEDGEADHVEYFGPMGELQDFVEEEVDKRRFKMRYDPREDQEHRSGLEIHVLPEKDSDEEFYFGRDTELYFGSTFSEADVIVNDVEDAQVYVRQELDALNWAN